MTEPREPLTTVVAGWTGRLPFTLYADGVAFNGFGMTLSALLLTKRDGTVIDTTGDFGWVDAASGTVYYDADADDWDPTLSPYRMRWEVTDGTGKKVYFPNSELPDLITVGPQR